MRARGGTKKHNWAESIVDLVKLLDMGSRLESRKRVAQSLGYK
ncbi:MAG: DUF3597 family protein [Pyrinomonadaceae bacterium]